MLNPVKELAKKVARILFGNYSLYYIYASEEPRGRTTSDDSDSVLSVERIDHDAVKSNSDPAIFEQASYVGKEAHAYACHVDDSIGGICIYWFGDRYRKRNFWSLKESEAKLVQIVTAPAFRRRGIATELISRSCQDMLNRGFTRLYARIWHSNSPSWRSFERAGWSRIALVLEVNPFRRERPIRLHFDI